MRSKRWTCCRAQQSEFDQWQQGTHKARSAVQTSIIVSGKDLASLRQGISTLGLATRQADLSATREATEELQQVGWQAC